jgi:hypothetical protein
VEQSGCSICLGMTRLRTEDNHNSQSGGYGEVEILDPTGALLDLFFEAQCVCSTGICYQGSVF